MKTWVLNLAPELVEPEPLAFCFIIHKQPFESCCKKQISNAFKATGIKGFYNSIGQAKVKDDFSGYTTAAGY